MMSFEDQYMDVLYNIESQILRIYRDHPNLCGVDVERGLDALRKLYVAEIRGQQPKKLMLNPLETIVFDKIRLICELHLGKAQPLDEDGNPIEIELTQLTLDEMVQCLKRIIRSVQLWTREAGSKGYMTYIQQFIEI